MQEVVHHVLRDRPIVSQEVPAKVEIGNPIVAVELGDTPIDLVDGATVGVGPFAAREDSEEEDTAARRSAMNLLTDGGDSEADLLRSVQRDVVRANHHHN